MLEIGLIFKCISNKNILYARRLVVYIGIKGDGGVKSEETRLLIEKEK